MKSSQLKSPLPLHGIVACFTMLVIVLAASGPASCGAHSYGNEKIADEKTLSKIKEGETTQAEVEQLLGKPMAVDFTHNGKEKWVYYYSSSKARGESYIPVVGMAAGGADYETRNLVILFNENGVVEKVGQGQDKGSANAFGN